MNTDRENRENRKERTDFYSRTCYICGLEVGLKAFGNHLKLWHPGVTPKIYYDTYLGQPNKCTVCHKDTNFISIPRGYNETCGSKCRNATPKWKANMKSKKIKEYMARPGKNFLGQREKEILDNLEILSGVKILRHQIIHPFRPDGIVESTKVIVEVDEHFHDIRSRERKDEARDAKLILLGYKVFRIKIDDWDNNKSKVVLRFKELL